MHHLVRTALTLALLLTAPLMAADAVLRVEATTVTGAALNYTWLVRSVPPGAVAPTGLAASASTSPTTTVSFAGDALPGTYVFEVEVRDGVAPVASSTTNIQVTRSQTISFPSGPTSFVLGTTPWADVDPGAGTSAVGLGVSYRVVAGTAATVVGNRLRPISTGSVTVEADVETHVPLRYRSNPRQRTYTFTAPTLTTQRIDLPIRSVTKFKGTGALTFTVQASATSGLPVRFTSRNDDIAQVTQDGVVTVLRDGVAVIAISQEGNAVYGPAAGEEFVLTVRLAVIEITAPLRALPAILDLP